MDLNKLYKLQKELDNHIWEKHGTLDKMSKEELLDNTILALLVEVGELANTTRCFKHWSTKGMMDKEIVLDELADVWHFYLSIGNQLGFKYYIDEIIFDELGNMVDDIIHLYKWISSSRLKGNKLVLTDYNYQMIGTGIVTIKKHLGFTSEQVEQAYLKKHEENYRRQREGY